MLSAKAGLNFPIKKQVLAFNMLHQPLYFYEKITNHLNV